VIDFRYHLVSIVAVFLALAIGIVLGAADLQGNTIDLLRSSSNSLRSDLNAAEAERDSYQTQANTAEQFLQTAEPTLLDGRLTGQRVVLITEPGAQASVVDGIKQAAVTAGAKVTGQVALQPMFNDISGATQSSLAAINNSIATSDSISLAPDANPQTVDQQQAAQLIAAAVTEKSATSRANISAADIQTLLTFYLQAGYLTVTGSPAAGATVAVIVTPQTAPTDGASDRANQVLVAVAQEFAAASAATVVAGSTAGSAQPGSAISVLRQSGVSSQVSSVDDADTTQGQIVVIEAIASQLAGSKPNSYGVSGASALSPDPLASAVPSPTATATAQPHSKATGKGGKPVKNK
jgi:hypothetical protein